MAARDFPHATRTEGIRFTSQVLAPILARGLLVRRPRIATAAERARLDVGAVTFMGTLRRRYGDGPVWIRAGRRKALLLLGPEPIRSVLERSPQPFATDPEPKRSAMRRFQPEALTISRQPDWTPRRRFAESVLDSGRPVHRLGDQFASIAVQEAQRLPASLDWETFHAAIRRTARRIVLGEGAAEDTDLSETLGRSIARANPPRRGDEPLRQSLMTDLRRHVERREAYSLAGLFRDAPQGPSVDPSEQAVQWLFALGDTLALNAYRCLAVLAASRVEQEEVRAEIERADLHTGHAIVDARRLRACLNETMRLWPTIPILARVATEATEIGGVSVPAGTRCLIVNTFNHRDELTLPYANTFSPEQWLTADAAERWSLNQFSHGPQVCPGVDLALLVGAATLAAILQTRTPRLTAPELSLRPPLPYSLDEFAIRIELDPR